MEWIEEWECNEITKDLDPHRRTCRPNYCFICNSNFVQAGQSKTLVKHRHENHYLCEPTTESFIEFEKFKEENIIVGDEKKSSLLSKYENDFRKIKTWGKKRSKCEKSQCNRCDLIFSTSVDGIIGHNQAHKNGDFIKIGKCRNAKSWEQVFRPEQHTFNNETGNFSIGSDAFLCDIIVPEDVIRSGDDIICRKCNKFKVDHYKKSGDLRSQAKKCSKFRLHESICRIVKKAQK